jgi:hypothetical protein
VIVAEINHDLPTTTHSTEAHRSCRPRDDAPELDRTIAERVTTSPDFLFLETVAKTVEVSVESPLISVFSCVPLREIAGLVRSPGTGMWNAIRGPSVSTLRSDHTRGQLSPTLLPSPSMPCSVQAEGLMGFQRQLFMAEVAAEMCNGIMIT